MPSFKPNQPLDTTPSSSPESSPPSSPAFGPVDSSPPSSPSIGPLSTPPESPGPLDPYAGSNKSSQRPRQYDAQKRVKPLGFGSLPKRVADAHDPFNDASPGPSRTSHLYQPVNIFHPYSEHDRPPRDTSVPRAPHVDPYAASAHKDWTPPRREKKPLARSSSATSAFEPKPPNEPNPSIIVVRPPSHSPDGDVLDAEDEEHPLGISLTDTEDQIWDKVFNGAVDKLDIDINLANSPLLSNPLTYIPLEVDDLRHVVVFRDRPEPSGTFSETTVPIRTERTFERSVTVPVMPHRRTPFLDHDATRKRFKASSASLVRTATAALHLDDASHSKGEIKLFLSNNKIRSLPLELFRIVGLTVLSLRSNQITFMPSQVGQLINLRELSIPFNKLRWLPAEMLGMQPMTLTVTRNEWIQPPAPPDGEAGAKPSAQPRPGRAESTRTHVSPITVHFTIPPLTEICLRVLCTPIAKVQTDEKSTVLQSVCRTPLNSHDCVPLHLLQTIRACVPDAVSKPAAQPSPAKRARHSRDPRSRGAERDAPAEEPQPGLSVCPSPVHRTPDGGWVGGRVPVYVRHAEERFTWEREIAGTDVKAECAGAGVPVRWRGCLHGCLDFLDPGMDAADTDEEGDISDGVVPRQVETELEDGLGVDAVDVQIVQFSDIEYDDEDFE